AAGAAMQAIERAQHEIAADPEVVDVSTEIAARLMEAYRGRIALRSGESEFDRGRLEAMERHLRLVGLRAERAEIRKLARARDIDEVIARKLIREIDL